MAHLVQEIALAAGTISPAGGGILVLLATLCSWHLLRKFWKLRDIPGPFWAKLTDLYRAGIVKTGRSHEIFQAYHQKHGALLRLGPNMVSVADPAEIPVIYPMRPGFPKGEFYDAFIPYIKGGSAPPAIFTARDEELHKRIKSPVAPLYSLSNAVKSEPFIDEVLDVLFDQLDARFEKSQATFDLADWLQFFAFDVMGTMTFSRRYGFLETGRDVQGILATIWNFMLTVGPMTQVPWLDKLLHKNAVMASFRKASGNVIFQIAADNVPLVWTFSNVIAGSDSTAVVMRTTMYNLLAHPSSLARLHRELTDPAITLSRPYPRWAEVANLPYLDACVNEAVRLHPPFCLPLERVVPTGGVTICGRFFEQGTVVGMNPYVVNRHRATFGDDADDWRPERWLEGDEERRRRMEAAIMTFGAGRRTCLGKHVALLEIKKIVTALVLNYEFKLVDPKAYVVENSYFFRQRGIMVQIKRHERS
ncbi:bf063f20-0ead-4d8d-8658-a664e452a012 [Thermothielavioides terrestris]|uniref:Bf063f20-0ead-4d8d-8658-a664e452a012 n=1 Tax=Thermothielavioides terrestris TaxID=2587410 RepID=A0A3S4B7X1_9PEZI|nr:bf063f20-0ead-4d8d-8658-a664e452a012 [Thermothielavioides terrestris]